MSKANQTAAEVIEHEGTDESAAEQQLAEVQSGGEMQTVALVGPAAILQAIQTAAADPNVDIDKMERLWDMHKQLVADQNETLFNIAMAAAQGEMTAVSADSRNEHTHSDYASYAALDKVVRPIYVKHGFALMFNTTESPKEEHERILCDVTNGGHTKSFHTDMPTDGKGAKGGDVMTKTHAMGSAVQYGMRYLLKMIFNLAVDKDGDDDGNNAGDSYERITEDQIKKIKSLLKDTDTDQAKFLEWSEVESIDEIPDYNFANTVDNLKRKKKLQEKQAESA